MSREYWNDIEIEKTKAFWVEDVFDLKLLHFLQNETNLQKCFQDGVGFAGQFDGGICGHILDIGAGVAWRMASDAWREGLWHVQRRSHPAVAFCRGKAKG